MQESQRGTGDAARVGVAALARTTARVIILAGDVPLVRAEDLRAVAGPLDDERTPALALATCVVLDPTGYGRILRQGDRITEVREHRDLQNAEQRSVREINAGIYAASVAVLREALASLTPNNAQGEL